MTRECFSNKKTLKELDFFGKFGYQESDAGNIFFQFFNRMDFLKNVSFQTLTREVKIVSTDSIEFEYREELTVTFHFLIRELSRLPCKEPSQSFPNPAFHQKTTNFRGDVNVQNETYSDAERCARSSKCITLRPKLFRFLGLSVFS